MKLIILALLLTCAAARAETITMLDPGPTWDYMPNWCGGTKLDEIAEGFDAAGNVVTIVTDSTRCNTGGRGSKARTFFVCYRVTFQEGAVISRELLTQASWVQGQPPIPCAVQADPAAIYTDAAGRTLTSAQISGALVYGPVYRAFLGTP